MPELNNMAETKEVLPAAPCPTRQMFLIESLSKIFIKTPF
jgi:hypothetical protein